MDDDESKEEIEQKKAAEDCLPQTSEHEPKTQTENAGGGIPPRNTRIGSSTPNKRPNHRHGKTPLDWTETPPYFAEVRPVQICIDQTLTIKELAQKLGIADVEVIKRLYMKGNMYTINQVVALEVAREFATDLGYELIESEPPEGG